MADGMWERVAEEGGVSTPRLKVADGWLYRVTTSEPAGVALAFASSGSGAGIVNAATPGDTTSNNAVPADGNQATEHVPRPDD